MDKTDILWLENERIKKKLDDCIKERDDLKRQLELWIDGTQISRKHNDTIQKLKEERDDYRRKMLDQIGEE